MNDLVPLGDCAFLARFATDDEAMRWGEAVRGRCSPGILDVVTAYATVAVHTDPALVDLETFPFWLRNIEPGTETKATKRLLNVPVVYDGIDLPTVARRCGIAERSVIEAHCASEYRVQAVGFLPGFFYAGDLPEAIRDLPRLESPRPLVPAGSVAIVGSQTGVYPSESPGGWHLIGRTPLLIVDVASGFFPVRVGDRLRFVPISNLEFEHRLGERLS